MVVLTDCAHDNEDLEDTGPRSQKCKICDTEFFYCNVCSEDGTVYHALPLCRDEV